MTKFKSYIVVILLMSLSWSCTGPDTGWKPDTDWGHWRLGHRSNYEFLKNNQFTITFGSGAPNFEYVTRQEFDEKMEEAKLFNQAYHDSGYIVLRYLSTSLNGETETNRDDPKKNQIHMLQFYNERWNNFKDYIGPKPSEDPTEWITVFPDGTFPHYRYAPYGRETDEGFETWGCPNNPHYVRMMEGRIRAQAETGIDGSYVDWTQIAGGTCYCQYCKESFVQYLKSNLPLEMAEAKYHTSEYENVSLPQRRGDDFWMEWIQFRSQSVANFHNRLRTAARMYNPHFMISGNIFGGFGYGPIAYDAAGNIEMLGKVDDFIYSEIQEFLDSAPRKDEKGTKITNSPALKFLAAASHGKPVIVYATEITPPIFPNPTEKCLSAMAQMNIAEAAANHAVFREKRQTPPGATAIHNFLAANEKSLRGAHLYSNIGILSSLRQYFADELSFAFSLSRVFADQSIGHVMLVEDDLDQIPDPIDLIILPYLPLLSAGHQQSLIRYVKKGGVVVVLGPCGIKNEFNVPQQKIPLLLSLEEGEYPDHPIDKRVGKGFLSYIPLNITASRFLIPMKSKGEFTTFGPTMADLFPDIPEGYTRNRMHRGLRRILGLTVKKTELLLSSNVNLADGSPYVELTTMFNETNKNMLFHLVNYDVTVEGVITPANNITIQVVIPEGKHVKDVLYSGTLSDMDSLPFTIVKRNRERLLVLELDSLEIYGLGVIQFK